MLRYIEEQEPEQEQEEEEEQEEEQEVAWWEFSKYQQITWASLTRCFEEKIVFLSYGRKSNIIQLYFSLLQERSQKLRKGGVLDHFQHSLMYIQ